MATFSKASFNAVRYNIARPTYPRQLFDFVSHFHEHGCLPASDISHHDQRSLKARWDLAVDLGCGTGQATAELSAFKRVVGVDPSAKMIESARKYVSEFLGGALESAQTGQVEFFQAPAEELGFLEDGSVDLVIAAQAAHWFDWNKLWPELARILRKDGTIAFWGYSEFRFTRYPSLTPLITAYSKGSDPLNSVGSYWEQPGRSIVDDHLRQVPSPSTVVSGAFEKEERVYFTGDHYPDLPNTRPVILRKKTTWEGFEEYLRSYSSLRNFQDCHPTDRERADGDIVVRFMEKIKKGMREEDGAADDDVVEIEWPLALIMAKRA